MRRVFVGLGVVAALAFALWHHGCWSTTTATTTSASKQVVRGHGHARPPAIASIAGTVTTDTGAPLAHARVCATPSSDELPSSLTSRPYCAFADERGNYVIGELFAAEYRVTAMSPRYPAVELAMFTLRDGEQRTNVNIVLKAGGVEVTGTVSDQSGGPIAHAWVSGYSLVAASSTPIVEADDHGAFELWMWPGDVAVTAAAEGYATASENGLAPGRIALELAPSSSIAGVVIDGLTHLPIVSAKVNFNSVFDITDEQGQFRIDDLRPGRYALTATAPHRAGSSEGSVLTGLAQHVDGVTISVYPAAAIEGSVVVDSVPATPCAKPDVTLEHDGPWISAANEPRGAVHFDAVMPGTYSVRVQCAGFIAVDDSIKLVVADRDIVGQVWRVHRGGTIHGYVRDATGAPITDATVLVDTPDFGRATSKADGSYEIDALRDGTHHITAERGNARSTVAEVDVVAGSVAARDLTLEHGGAISITVTDGDGTRVANAVVTIDDSAQGQTADDGTLHVDAFAGTHDLVVETPGGSRRTQHVTVTSDRTETVSVVVDARHGTIKGIVVDAAGAPATDAYVTALRDGGGNSELPRVLVRPDGTFTLSPLASGTFGIYAEQTEAATTFVEHVPLGSTIRIELRPLGSIAGRVSADPAELELRIEDLRQSGGWRSEIFFHTHGAFHVDDLAAGTYRITAEVDGAHAQRTVELAEGAHLTNVDLAVDASLGLVGRVIDLKTKQPLPGVEVFAWLQGIDTRAHNTTDGDGRFTISGLTHGYVDIYTSADAYADARLDRQIDTGNVVDLGDIAVVQERVKFGHPIGRIGVRFGDALRVDSIDPAGAAAHSALVVGDVVTSIDGIDVTGAPMSTAYAMIKAPPGTTIQLGLARGIAVSITAR